MVLSSKKVAGQGLKPLWWSIVASLVLTAILTLVFARSLLGVIVSIVAIVLALGVTLLLARALEVVVEVHDGELVLRIPRLYKKKLSPSEIVSVAVGPETSLIEGYGIRYLGKNRRGLLVGGPSVSITTSAQEILVSCDDPKPLAQQIENFAHQKQPSTLTKPR